MIGRNGGLQRDAGGGNARLDDLAGILREHARSEYRKAWNAQIEPSRHGARPRLPRTAIRPED
jgi:hypothetical protein